MKVALAAITVSAPALLFGGASFRLRKPVPRLRLLPLLKRKTFASSTFH